MSTLWKLIKKFRLLCKINFTFKSWGTSKIYYFKHANSSSDKIDFLIYHSLTVNNKETNENALILCFNKNIADIWRICFTVDIAYTLDLIEKHSSTVIHKKINENQHFALIKILHHHLYLVIVIQRSFSQHIE